jgi:hypothetical protein
MAMIMPQMTATPNQTNRNEIAATTYFISPPSSLDQLKYFVNAPNMVSDTRFHRLRHAQRLVSTAEIVVPTISGLGFHFTVILTAPECPVWAR